MLIIVPSSETKRPAPSRGRPVDLGALSFPALAGVRERVLDALVATSTGPDALSRLRVTPVMGAEVARNTRLRDLVARPALEVYAGTLHDALDADSLSTAARRRALRRVVIASSLWGLLRPGDRIPPYRLDICSRLVGIDGLEATWRTVLPDVLAEAAGPRGVIVDLRSGGYRTCGMPAGLGDRTVVLAVACDNPARRPGNVFVKRARGLAARHLLETGADPRHPAALAAALGERWPVRLASPSTRGGPWTLTVVLPADGGDVARG
ncbi:MAG TPA: peroxide stress protein YaaA [Candidatus Limnocylindrales bacterium]|nr:peroxide stress protein YaaA [Candidatus Limnocylindrales bacterium]